MFFRTLASLYSPRISVDLIAKLEQTRFRPFKYLSWFWQAKDYNADTANISVSARIGGVFVLLGITAQVAAGIACLIDWARFGTDGMWEFGAALILSYPLVWAHILALLAVCYRTGYYLLHPKKLGRDIVCSILERQVLRLRMKHKFSVIAVAGSVGKTSTKLAIADILGHSQRVLYQAGNYNDRVTVPLVFFGQKEPELFNIRVWLAVLRNNRQALARPYDYDAVIVELGTDGPGQMADFAYLKPDITVVTAISPEHMEYFGTLDAVASEELSIFEYSRRVLVNADDTPGIYLVERNFSEYSLLSKQAEYYAGCTDHGLKGQTLQVTTPGGSLSADIALIGQQGAKFALAAAAVADMLTVNHEDIASGLGKVSPFAGRMQILSGKNSTKLIDDTYNASPIAIKAALDVLYKTKTAQRIAILGSMNELGDYSAEAHREVGTYCDPTKLAYVVTIGTDAATYLAPAAVEQGCKVELFKNPYEAGQFVAQKLQKGGVVLAKGSQNGVFAEEALKPLLANSQDATKLVRQSPYWLKQKQQLNG